MLKVLKTKEYALCPEAVDEIAEDIVAFCLGQGSDKETALRARINAEEVLLHYLDHGYDGAKVVIRYGRTLRSRKIELTVAGDSYNPLQQQSEEMGTLNRRYYLFAGMLPVWQYKNGLNSFEYTIPRKPRSQLARLITVLTLAVLVGVLGKLALPREVLDFCVNTAIPPLYGVYFSVLGCVACPMIFLSVTNGIYGIGDSAVFGTLGRRMLLSCLGVSLAGSLVGLCYLPLSGLSVAGTAGGNSQFDSILNMLVGIIPSNIVEPFATGNTLQVITLAVAVGTSLLFLGRKTEAVGTLLEQSNALVEYIMGFVSKLVPYAVFLILVKLIWSDALSLFADMWKPVLVYFALYLLFMAGYTVYTALRCGVHPGRLLMKLLPIYVLALTTASSAAAFSTVVDISEKKLGIKKSVSAFGVPLGIVIQKPASCIYLMLLMLYLCRSYDIAASPLWVITLVLTVTLYAVATPPVSGGMAAMYALLIAQVGLPAEVIGIALAVDIVADFFDTSLNTYCVPLTLMNCAGAMGMVKPGEKEE